jgi:hypothetical protein
VPFLFTISSFPHFPQSSSGHRRPTCCNPQGRIGPKQERYRCVSGEKTERLVSVSYNCPAVFERFQRVPVHFRSILSTIYAQTRRFVLIHGCDKYVPGAFCSPKPRNCYLAVGKPLTPTLSRSGDRGLTCLFRFRSFLISHFPVKFHCFWTQPQLAATLIVGDDRL